MKYRLLLVVVILLPLCAQAQSTHEAGRVIDFPDIPGFVTLKCDLHIHTVFSDGGVWPDIRVKEALRDGLDAISLTEHLEYQPHEDDIPHPDRNRSHDIGVKAAGESGLILLRGSEITRDLPPGHANAVFIEDANRLLMDEPIDVFREAGRQGAFTFWNHPDWISQKKDGIATLSDIHIQLIREGLLSGIEVVNTKTYSEEALQIALDNNLTILGTSDVHGLIDWDYEVAYGGHRPITLVFATERSEAGIKEGLEARRTVVWHNNTLVGRDEHVVPLILASLTVTKAVYIGDSSVLSVLIENTSDVEYILDSKSSYSFHGSPDVLTIAPHETTRIDVKTIEILSSLSLPFEVLNAVSAPDKHPEITLDIKVE